MAGYKFPDELEEEKKKGADEIEVVMPDEEGGVEIEEIDDTPPADRGRKPLNEQVEEPTDEELAQYSEKVQNRIRTLTHARHDERRKAESLAREKLEVENLARSALEEVKQLREVMKSGATVHKDTLKAAAEGDLAVARRELKDAMEAFDNDAIVTAQEKLYAAQMKKDRAENFEAPAVQPAKSDVRSEQQYVPPTPDDKALDWQAKNQWFGKDEEATAFALGAHKKLVETGVTAGSSAYYEQLDARMKAKFPEIVGAATPPARKPATTVAPATRNTGPKKIQLTTTQVALAKKYGLTLQQYAAQVAKLESANG